MSEVKTTLRLINPDDLQVEIKMVMPLKTAKSINGMLRDNPYADGKWEFSRALTNVIEEAEHVFDDTRVFTNS